MNKSPAVFHFGASWLWNYSSQIWEWQFNSIYLNSHKYCSWKNGRNSYESYRRLWHDFLTAHMMTWNLISVETVHSFFILRNSHKNTHCNSKARMLQNEKRLGFHLFIQEASWHDFGGRKLGYASLSWLNTRTVYHITNHRPVQLIIHKYLKRLHFVLDHCV